MCRSSIRDYGGIRQSQLRIRPRLLREGGEGFAEAIQAAGHGPRDTSPPEWSDPMRIEESLGRDGVSEMLGEAIDGPAPGTTG